MSLGVWVCFDHSAPEGYKNKASLTVLNVYSLTNAEH